MGASDHKGRLELTWTNKGKRLLAHEDESYEWVDPADYRVSEVRLLHDEVCVGGTKSERNRAKDNLLIRGDALCALTSLLELPEFAREYAGKVRLVYIDPPFNTGQTFQQYDDGLEHSVWLTMIRDRMLQVKELLSRDGSIWLHLDDVEVHRARCVMDEVFGSDNFVANVIWEKTDSPRMDASYFSCRHDHVLVYRSSEATKFNHLVATDVGNYKKVDEEGRRYYLNPLRARGGQGSTRIARPTLFFAMEAPDGTNVYPKLPDGGDGAWRWSRGKVDRENYRIEWTKGKKGWTPNYRIYEPEERTRPPETIWLHEDVGSTRTSNREIKDLLEGRSFSTPKPEAFLHRVLSVGSDPGDIVIDCFLGSGTTAAVAHKMGRRWVGVERSGETIANFALPRLTKVVGGEDSGGVTGTTEWLGGGGFRVLEVAPSMFDDDEGRVVLADWATNGKLGEATAAQLGFEHAEEPPFCGRKGRAMLAVVDGLVNEDVVRVLVGSLPEDERVVICGTSLDPSARATLRELRRGSTMRKIPASILDEYRQRRRSQLRESMDWEDAVKALDGGA